MSESITITKALQDLKTLNKRIKRTITDTEFVGYVEGEDKTVNQVTIDQFNSNASSAFDSVLDLIAYRNAVKSAIVASNAVTKVTVAGKEYTVAEAIERKNSIEYEVLLLHYLKTQYAKAKEDIDSINDTVKDRLDNTLESMLSKDGKQNNDLIQSFTDDFNKKNQAKLVDPIQIKAKIEDLEIEIEDFSGEVDQALSVSNATTTIEI